MKEGKGTSTYFTYFTYFTYLSTHLCTLPIPLHTLLTFPYLPTYLPSYLPTFLPIHPPTHTHTHPHPHTHPPTHPLTQYYQNKTYVFHIKMRQLFYSLCKNVFPILNRHCLNLNAINLNFVQLVGNIVFYKL